jgi:hypothetical protein
LAEGSQRAEPCRDFYRSRLLLSAARRRRPLVIHLGLRKPRVGQVFVTMEKVGRVRTCRLGLRRLEEEAMWIERYRQLWEARFGELDKVVEELKRKERVDGRRKT